ncbi:MAG: hypothetical protein L6R41_000836 [Letrouitia leprolyta]|nr:MAG: hypothetical protein L6R41_000836 [Letrouitia leprolyta]
MLVFTVGSIVCAVSYNFTMMLAGRSVQGSGSGGILAMTQILITDMVPLRERAKYFSLINIVWATGGVSGPLIGGALASANAWRWIFYLNLPIVAVGFIGIIAFLKLRNTCRTLREKLLEVDYIDSIIHLPSLTSFLMGVTWAGVQYAWDSWPTVVPISVGAFGLIVFAFWEAIGVAIGGVIFQDRMVTNLSRHPELSASATSNSQDVMGMIQWVNMTPASDPRKHVVAVSLSESIGSMWVIMCGLGGLALISTIFLDAYSLNQAIATEQRFLGQHLKEKVENP